MIGSLRRTFGLSVPPLLFLLLVVAVPMVAMVNASFHRQDFGVIQPGITVENYQEILGSARYGALFASTGFAAGCISLICLLLGFPVALLIAASPASRRPLLYFLVSAPLLINTVVRSYGWLLMLGNRGVINGLLMETGLITQPLALSGNMLGLVIGGSQVYLPFMILTLVAALDAIDGRLLEAAMMLGASRAKCFRDIVLPLAAPGMVAGCVLVFTLMLGAIITPMMLGGSAIRYLSVTIYTDAMVLFDLPRATALSIVLLAGAVVLQGLQHWLSNRDVAV